MACRGRGGTRISRHARHTMSIQSRPWRPNAFGLVDALLLPLYRLTCFVGSFVSSSLGQHSLQESAVFEKKKKIREMASRLAFTLLVATLACVAGLAMAGDPHLGSLEYSFYDSGGAQLTGDTEVDLPAALSLDEQYTFVVVVPQATVAIEQVALVFVGVVDTAIAGDVVSGELIPFASGTDVATISLTVTDTNDGETQEYVVVFMRNFGVIENLPVGLNSDMEANVMVSLVDNYAAAGFDPLDLDLDALAGIVASLTRVVGSGTLDVSLLGMFEIFDLAVALVVAADDLSLFPNLAEVGAGLASQLNEVMNDGDSVTCDDCYGGESHFVLGKFDSMVASKVLCNAPGGLGTGSDLCIDFGTTFPTTATSVLVTLIMAPPAGPIDGDDDLADNLDTFSSYLVNLYDGDTGDAIVVNSGASINQAFTNPMVAGVPNEVTDTAPATGFISTFSAGYFDGDDAKDNGVSDVTCDDAASTCSFDATHLTGFFVAVDACASYSLCGTCTAQPECGWCNSANLCATGDASGPTEGGSYCPGTHPCVVGCFFVVGGVMGVVLVLVWLPVTPAAMFSAFLPYLVVLLMPPNT